MNTKKVKALTVSVRKYGLSFDPMDEPIILRVLVCPFCGERHEHVWTGEHNGDSLGIYRPACYLYSVAHIVPREYELIDATPEQEAELRRISRIRSPWRVAVGPLMEVSSRHNSFRMANYAFEQTQPHYGVWASLYNERLAQLKRIISNDGCSMLSPSAADASTKLAF